MEESIDEQAGEASVNLENSNSKQRFKTTKNKGNVEFEPKRPRKKYIKVAVRDAQAGSFARYLGAMGEGAIPSGRPSSGADGFGDK